LAGSSNAFATSITFGSGANQFAMEFVTIGNPGNEPDRTGTPNPAGAVGYTYSMGKYEVSQDMITKYNAAFGTANGLAITQSNWNGVNKPATLVSWNEAARFTNWLNTSTGGFAAYKFTTSGVNDNIALWTPSDTLDYDPSNAFRSLRANYVLPSVNEWYKAAYYDPIAGVYYDYPTGSNSVPDGIDFRNDPEFDAVFDQGGLNNEPNDITNVGLLSPFGTAGQGGNVLEWEETETDLVNNNRFSPRGVRAGRWSDNSINLLSSTRNQDAPGTQSVVTGFRVVSLSSSATVPEPSSIAIWSLIGVCGLRHRRFRTNHP
jgi:formylglycine-generating enzyme required for sulfatase activity